jgi:hypothetical protein
MRKRNPFTRPEVDSRFWAFGRLYGEFALWGDTWLMPRVDGTLKGSVWNVRINFLRFSATVGLNFVGRPLYMLLR